MFSFSVTRTDAVCWNVTQFVLPVKQTNKKRIRCHNYEKDKYTIISMGYSQCELIFIHSVTHSFKSYQKTKWGQHWVHQYHTSFRYTAWVSLTHCRAFTFPLHYSRWVGCVVMWYTFTFKPGGLIKINTLNNFSGESSFLKIKKTLFAIDIMREKEGERKRRQSPRFWETSPPNDQIDQ